MAGRHFIPYAHLCFTILLAFVPAFAAKTASVAGVIYTVGTDNVQTLSPGARLSLKNLSTNTEISTVSDNLGAYAFTGLLAGDYEVTVTLAGVSPATRRVTLSEGDKKQLDFQLVLAPQRQSITVTGNPATVDVTSTSTATPAITSQTLRSVVRMNQDFQDALPLIPGVVRGP